MSQVNLNSDKHIIRADSVTIWADKEPIIMGPIVLPARNGALSGGLVIAKSSTEYLSISLVDSRGVIPTGKHLLNVTRLNNTAYFTFQQIDGATPFTVGATNTPLWLGAWPIQSRPRDGNPSYMPLLVQKDTGQREMMFMVVSPNGDITLNPGNSTLFTSGNLLYLGGSGSFAIEGY